MMNLQLGALEKAHGTIIDDPVANDCRILAEIVVAAHRVLNRNMWWRGAWIGAGSSRDLRSGRAAFWIRISLVRSVTSAF